MYKISLTEDDFLLYQLYASSKSTQVKKARMRSRIVITLSFLILALLFFESQNPLLGYYFIAVGILALLFYPFYQRWKYKKHYLKHIRENYKNRFNVESEMKLNGEFILTSDNSSEGKIKTSEIERIDEMSSHYFIKIKSRQSLIIPKEQVSHDSFINDISSIVEEHKIKWNKELEWKWK